MESFDDGLRTLAARMFELMRAAKGVGLAAPQVGINLRLFVMNHSGDPKDDRVYVSPVLSDPEGDDEAEEGCLSLPRINVNVLRSRGLKIKARDLEGKVIEEIASGYLARIWQHEVDHLDGILLIDKMGPLGKLAHRKAMKELEDRYIAEYGALPSRPKAVKSAKPKPRRRAGA